MIARLASHADADAVESDALWGLVDAARRYDARTGVAFWSFAAPRVRGAVFDGLRARDSVSRRVRTAQRAIDATSDGLAQQLGRVPTASECATARGWSHAQHATHTHELALATPTYFDEAYGSASDDATEALDARDAVRRALRTLDARARFIVIAHDLQGVPMRTIAAQLGVSEGRVSQLRTRALAAMRDVLSV